MDTEILHYVLVLANEKNFSRAAEKLHLAQPSLSYQIIKLEKELGTQLFERRTGEIQVTHAGKIFIENAHKIIDQIQQLNKEMLRVRGMEKGELTIGSLAITGAHLLPRALPIFQHKFPGVELVLIEDSNTNLESLVSRGEVEIALLSMPVVNPKLQIENILDEEIFLAVPPTHRFSALQFIDLAECEDESFILLKKGHGFRTTTENICKEAGFEPKVIFESINIDTCQSLVSVGVGISFVPRMVLRKADSPDTPVYLPIKHLTKKIRSVVFAYKNGKQLSKPARSFIDIMKTVAIENDEK